MKFDVTGNLADTPRSGHPRTAPSGENKRNVANSLLNNPQQSIRIASVELNISTASVHGILKQWNMKPDAYVRRTGVLEVTPTND